jgi:RimJ/RimL family protein N-acetyltransferase
MVTAIAENQEDVALALSASGAARSLGRASGVAAEDVTRALEGVLGDPEALRAMGSRGLEVLGESTHMRWKPLIGELLDSTPRVIPGEFALRPMAAGDLDLVLGWRNSERVRNAMFSTDLIGEAEHERWWASRSPDESAHFVFEAAGRPVGLVYFEDADSLTGASSWGFYLGAVDASPGTGSRMCYMGLEAGFKLGLRSVFAGVRPENEGSLRIHERMGFRELTCDEMRCRPSPMSDDARCFELTLAAWQETRGQLHSRLFG